MVLQRTAAYSAALSALLVGVVLTSATVGQADVGYRAVTLAVLNGLSVPLVTADGPRRGRRRRSEERRVGKEC